MRGKAPQKDNGERYLLTYSDLMNLLLILFIVLFAVSKQDVKKTAEVMNGIKSSFNGKPTSSAVAGKSSSKAGSGNSTAGKTAQSTDYSDFYNQLIGLLKNRGLLDKVDITQTDNEVIITLKDTVLFAPSKADLGADSTSLLNTIGGLMTKISFGQLLIEGHTDSDPIHTSAFPDNTMLSSARAHNVFVVFKQAGIDPKKMLPVGYGEYFPVAPNDTVENKAKNRRVVLTILRKAVKPADETISSEDLVKTLQDAAVGKTDQGTSSSSKSSTSKSSSKATK